MGTSKERKERLAAIPGMIKENGGSIQFGELYAKTAMLWGVSEKTLWDYISVLKDAKIIKYPDIWSITIGGPKGPLITLYDYVPPPETEQQKKNREAFMKRS